MGESLEARMAGAMPKITPTATEKAKARTIDHGVTCEIKNFAMM